MSTFTHQIRVQAILDNGTILDVSNIHPITNVLFVSHGVANMEEQGFGGIDGFPAGEAHDFLIVKMVDGDGHIEWDNGDTQPLSMDLMPGQSFALLSGKSYDRSTNAADATVTNTDIAVDTATSGRGVRFEYLILNNTAS
jgi:hypothetical protein